jgi:hypothetical protein
MTTIAGTALSALILAGLLMVPSSTALAGPPEPRELPGLREAPDIPVGSIFLRRELPGHPLPPAVEREFPGPDAPGLDGRPPPPGGGGCDKDVDLNGAGAIGGVENVAALDTGICTNADIDTYVDAKFGVDTYVVQAGGEEMAWTHTDVSDPSNPVMVGQFFWDGASGRNTYTPDIKAFSQGDQDYIVMGMERMKVRAFCGVIIVNVTDPLTPLIESQFIGANWCDTHNVFVEVENNTLSPAFGDGKYIYATADGTNDLRVLDISNEVLPSDDLNFPCDHCVTDPVEIGRYTAPTANNDNYVHDVTVLSHSALVDVVDGVVVDDGRRVYLSYWDSGLIILNAADVTPGTNPTPIIGPNVLDPANFLNHHSFPSQDGNFVFIQDEFLNSDGDEPVQMWDISDPTDPFYPSYVDGLKLGTDVPVNPAHNLEIRYDNLIPERLYVAWYKLGLQAWDFDSGGFLPEPLTGDALPEVFHQAQTETDDEAYSGAWGVRLEWIGAFLYIFQSDRNFGLIVDCVGDGCADQPTGTVTGTITKAGGPINGALVVADTGQEFTTSADGVYTLTNVPTGNRTVTASATGYDTQQKPATVNADETTVVNFTLDQESTGGTGTIKGTVTDDSTDAGLSGVLVETDLGQSATTNRRGKYNIKNVPAGSRTVTASKTGYVKQEDLPAPVTAGQTRTVNIRLVPQ